MIIKHSTFNIVCLCLPLPLLFMISLLLCSCFQGRVERSRLNMLDYSWQVLAGRSCTQPGLMLFFYSSYAGSGPGRWASEGVPPLWRRRSDWISMGSILRLCFSTLLLSLLRSLLHLSCWGGYGPPPPPPPPPARSKEETCSVPVRCVQCWWAVFSLREPWERVRGEGSHYKMPRVSGQ